MIDNIKSKSLYKVKYYYKTSIVVGPLPPSIVYRNMFVLAADVADACKLVNLYARDRLSDIASAEMLESPPGISIDSVEFVIAGADIVYEGM